MAGTSLKPFEETSSTLAQPGSDIASKPQPAAEVRSGDGIASLAIEPPAKSKFKELFDAAVARQSGATTAQPASAQERRSPKSAGTDVDDGGLQSTSKEEWAALCERVARSMTDPAKQAYIRKRGPKHPPLDVLPEIEVPCASSLYGLCTAHLQPGYGVEAVEAPQWRFPTVDPHKPTLCVSSPVPKRARVAVASPRRRGGVAVLASNSSSPEGANSSRCCKICKLELPVRSGFCSSCDDLRKHAKNLGFRLLEVRKAMAAGYLKGGLSKDAFHNIMRAFMRGDLDERGQETGKNELQAGARAERMLKRNRPE